jgi:hypothetical protein
VQQATWAYSGLISTQVKWLIGRVVSVSRTAPEIVRFGRAAEYYRAQEVFVSTVPPEPDNRTDDEFEQDWEKEHAARDALIEQVRLLADMRNPPPVPLRRRLKSRWQKARPQLKRG